MVEFLNAKFLDVAKAAGVIGHRRAVDSTGISDSVLTQDTVSLIRSALRACMGRLAQVSSEKATEVSSRLARDDYEAPGKPQICWSSDSERAALIADLFADAQAVTAACEGLDDADLATAASVLATVAGQDIEEKPDDEGRYLPVLRQGVAVERVISTVDVDARHGHRSRRDRYDGYKLHLAVDIDSDLLTAASASLATAHDATVLPDLLDADPVPVAEVLADTHYGGAKVRRELGAQGIELVAPAPPASAPKGLFNKSEFVVDLEARTVTCPAGQVTTIPPVGARGRAQARFGDTCATCPLRPRCTSSPRGRIVEINADEELLAAARAQRWTPEFRQRYGERSRIERKAAQVKYRSPKLPWRGLAKADAWVKLKVAALNLDRIGRLGLLGG